MRSKKKKKKKRFKSRRDLSYEQDRTDSSKPRPEYSWLSGVNSNGGPSNPSGVPGGVGRHSIDPDETLASSWVLSNCRFARS